MNNKPFPTPGPAHIAIADANNFFASCEQAADPRLRGKPVGVLSSNDGCIIARSAELRALKVPMGVPVFQVRDIIRKHNVTLRSGNFALYRDVSARMMRIYQECLPQVEIYSVDEVFVHLEGLGRYVDAEHLLQHTRQRIWQELRIPVSMGLGPGKVLAKLANRQGKQAGIALFRWPAEAAGAQRLLMQTPTADVWGIARRLSARMAARAIYTAWDFCQLPERYVQKQWGTPLLRIWHELRGQPMVYEEVAPTQRKSVLVSRSFPTDISTVPELEAAISWFVRCAAQKLMHKQLEARKMAIFLRTNRHKAMDQHRIYQEIALPCPTVYPPLLQRHALQALHASIRPGIAYKKAGVLLWDFCPMGQRQTTLFTPAGTDKQQRLLQAVRHMNSKTDTRIQWASFWQYNQHTDWRGRSEHTTPTTDLSPEEQRQIPIWYALDDDSL